MLKIPSNAVLEGRARSAKNVEGTSNCQMDFATTAILDEVQIMNATATAGVCDRYGAPVCQS